MADPQNQISPRSDILRLAGISISSDPASGSALWDIIGIEKGDTDKEVRQKYESVRDKLRGLAGLTADQYRARDQLLDRLAEFISSNPKYGKKVADEEKEEEQEEKNQSKGGVPSGSGSPPDSTEVSGSSNLPDLPKNPKPLPTPKALPSGSDSQAKVDYDESPMKPASEVKVDLTSPSTPDIDTGVGSSSSSFPLSSSSSGGSGNPFANLWAWMWRGRGGKKDNLPATTLEIPADGERFIEPAPDANLQEASKSLDRGEIPLPKGTTRVENLTSSGEQIKDEDNEEELTLLERIAAALEGFEDRINDFWDGVFGALGFDSGKREGGTDPRPLPDTELETEEDIKKAKKTRVNETIIELLPPPEVPKTELNKTILETPQPPQQDKTVVKGPGTTKFETPEFEFDAGATVVEGGGGGPGKTTVVEGGDGGGGGAEDLPFPGMTTPDLDGFRSGLAGLFDRIFSALGSSAEQLAQARLHQAQKSKHKAQADIYQYPIDLKEAENELYTAETDLTTATRTGVGVEEAKSKVEKAKAKVEGTQRRGEAAPARLEAAKVAYSKAQDDVETSQNPMNKAFAAFNVLKGSSIGQAAGAVFQGAKDFATGAKDDKPGEAMGGLLGGAGNALMVTGNPIGMAAGALLKVGEAALKSVEQIREFADGLHKANMNFAEFSSSMAEVKAVRQVQEIELSQKRGERRASSAKDLSDAQMEFEQHWSYISDALANIVNALTAGVLRAMAGMASTLTGIEANTSKLPEEGTATFRSIIEEQLDLEARRRLGQDLNRPRL